MASYKTNLKQFKTTVITQFLQVLRVETKSNNGSEYLDEMRRSSIDVLVADGMCKYTPSLENKIVERKTESRVLVIYTGGTIGMIPNSFTNALAPQANMLEARIRQSIDMHDAAYAEQHLLEEESLLALPISCEQNRIIYRIEEYNPLLDSSNMTSDEWKQIAMTIKDNYKKFNGFVILHGTDTLAYTASALSFMLENLGKPIVITGSQLPIFECRSDGKTNFISALTIAGNYNIPEVTVFFNNTLLRGNRTVKVSTNNFNAFSTPNCPALATIGIRIDVDYKSVFRPTGIHEFRVHSHFEKNVMIIRLFPNIPTEMVRNILKSPGLKGVVLQSFGAGNIPSRQVDLLDELKQASKRGVLIVNCTQCYQGGVEEIYETGKHLIEAGVIPGSDMTSEAAFTKLSYVLSKDEWNYTMKKKMFQTNLRGELTALRTKEDSDLVEAVAKSLGASTPREISDLRHLLHPTLLSGAVLIGDTITLNTLWQRGCDLSAPNCDRRTPLHIACAEGRYDVVRFLLNHGANVHMIDRFNQPPLGDAIHSDSHDIISLLIKCGAHLTSSPVVIGDQLCLAAARGNILRLRSYKLAGADLNIQDISGRTALHMAVIHNHIDVVRFLIDEEVDLEIEDIVGITPILIAEKLKQTDIQNLLKNKLQKPVS